MIRTPARLLALMGCLSLSSVLPAADLTLSPDDRLLIVVPHPDDEVLCCGGLIAQAVESHVPVKIVLVTYGDNNAWSFMMYRHSLIFRPKTMRVMGEVRRNETLAAAGALGVASDELIFLGYPDLGMLSIWQGHWGATPAYESRMTRVQAVPYSTAYRPGAPYTGDAVLQDLQSILKEVQPTKIFIPDPADLQSDHRAVYHFAHTALKNTPTATYSYLIHFPSWPPHRGLHADQALAPPPAFEKPACWLTFPLTPSQADKKYAALKLHQTQWSYSRRSMSTYVRKNELFCDRQSAGDPER